MAHNSQQRHTSMSGKAGTLIQPARARGFAIATSYFLAVGAGDGTTPLVAFDRALLAAGVADVNLVKLSSIVPPMATRIPPLLLVAGAFVGVAHATFTSRCPRQRIASAVAIAHPVDRSLASVVMEHSAAAATKDDVEATVVEMARDAMASRRRPVAYIESIAIEHVVEVVGATFAAVVEVHE